MLYALGPTVIDVEMWCCEVGKYQAAEVCAPPHTVMDHHSHRVHSLDCVCRSFEMGSGGCLSRATGRTRMHRCDVCLTTQVEIRYTTHTLLSTTIHLMHQPHHPDPRPVLQSARFPLRFRSRTSRQCRSAVWCPSSVALWTLSWSRLFRPRLRRRPRCGPPLKAPLHIASWRPRRVLPPFCRPPLEPPHRGRRRSRRRSRRRGRRRWRITTWRPRRVPPLNCRPPLEPPHRMGLYAAMWRPR